MAHKPLEDNHVVQVAVGWKHALLLTDEGIVYSWGTNNDHGCLGRAAADEQTMQAPTPITDTFKGDKTLTVIVQIACGLEHSLALDKDGKLYSWGRNKAGQLGLDGYSPGKQQQQKQTAPTLVYHFEGGTLAARSCACGPESSACIDMNGDIYVWGACSFYMFGEGRGYEKGENCTIPVKIRGVGGPQSWTFANQNFTPDKVALFKTSLATTVSYQVPNEELLSLIDLRKARCSMLTAASRKLGRNVAVKDDDVAGTEDLRQLDRDYKEIRSDLTYRISEMDEKLKNNQDELRRVTRELTICDQQDTAYNENASLLEVKRSEIQGKQQHVHLIDSQLNDINQFKASNRRNKVEYLAIRDKLEQENWKLNQDLNQANANLLQANARSKLMHALSKGDVGKGGGAAVDDGLRIASSKREELSATYPQTLAGVGQFNGFREVLGISDRALQDVSSALKEVSAAASGGDGAVLEEVLESNLKLRKEYNMLITEKVAKVDEPTGLLHEFWNETKSGPSQEEAIADNKFGLPMALA